MATELVTAEAFEADLRERADASRIPDLERYFRHHDDVFIGVRMGDVNAVAKKFKALPLGEIEKLLDSPVHEIRIGGLKVMAAQSQSKRAPEERKRELFDLYLRRHDAIDNWDLVDTSCKWVIGSYLADKPRDLLYELAKSDNLWERRTAIISTSYFIGKGELDDTFRISEMLLCDKEDLIHKAVGWMLREAGARDRHRLEEFLDLHAATMPRTALRYAIEHFDAEERRHYMELKNKR